MKEGKKRGSNIEQMRKISDDNRKGGGDFFKFDAGETLCYIHPPCRDGDEFEPTKNSPFIALGVHYGIGSANGMAASLDPEDNPIIKHPFVRAELKKAGKKLTGKCPIKAALEGNSLTDEEADDMKLQVRFLWGIKPLGFRKSKKADAKFMELDEDHTVLFCGPQINDQLIELFEEHGDITDPDGAIRVIISKTDKPQIAYKVKAYGVDVKKALVFSKKEKAELMKSLAGPTDLFRVVAGIIKPPGKLAGLLGDEEEDDDDSSKRSKKGTKGKDKKKASKRDEEEDDDEDEEEEDESDEEEEESDDDESEDEDDEEEEEEKPKAKKGKASKASKKSKSKDDDDEDEEEEADEEEDDESEDDDEDDDEPPKRSKKSAKGKDKKSAKSKSKSKDDDEDDDLDMEELESALEDVDDEDDDEDEKPAKKKKSSKK